MNMHTTSIPMPGVLPKTETCPACGRAVGEDCLRAAACVAAARKKETAALTASSELLAYGISEAPAVLTAAEIDGADPEAALLSHLATELGTRLRARAVLDETERAHRNDFKRCSEAQLTRWVWKPMRNVFPIHERTLENLRLVVECFAREKDLPSVRFNVSKEIERVLPPNGGRWFVGAVVTIAAPGHRDRYVVVESPWSER